MKLRLTSLETIALTVLVVVIAVALAVTSCPTGDRAAAERHIAEADSVAAVIVATKEASVSADSAAAKSSRKRAAKPRKPAASKAVSRNYLDEPVNE